MSVPHKEPGRNASSRKPLAQRIHVKPRQTQIDGFRTLIDYVPVEVSFDLPRNHRVDSTSPDGIGERSLCRFVASGLVFNLPVLDVGGFATRIFPK
jgi:hypothetical protein